jgi:dolichyl-phosphate beta-glucosyltransferase
LTDNAVPYEQSRPVWSVVIPAYNEEERLPVYLREVVSFFDAKGEPYEVIVVDDGSHDRTNKIVQELSAAHESIRLIAFPQNHGKGFAVKAGMLSATGAFRLFADADGATPIRELARLEHALQGGADLVIGSRSLPDPEVTVRARTHRILAGRLFNWMVARLGLRKIADSQCGFKCFRASVAEDLFRSISTNGFGFDVELLLLAQRRGYRIAEVPVNWTEQSGSKVRLLTDGPRMLWQIFKVRRSLAHQKR